ncbi:DNA polymerase III subunit psi [Glaesserella sp.]|uniref:DNA polymerase III subunit psi n=1 Tax=Glaesserella sp. TaxID=2094731 RepID=UPI0035A10098
MNRRDLLLNEMNITQWVLIKPQVLKGDAQIRLSEQVKFVVVCEENQQQSGFFQDVLRALDLKSDEYQWLTLEQTMRLAFDHSPIFWLIQAEEQSAKFAKKYPKQTAWTQTSWQEIHQPQQKRRLWQQMQPFCRHFEDSQ